MAAFRRQALGELQPSSETLAKYTCLSHLKTESSPKMTTHTLTHTNTFFFLVFKRELLEADSGGKGAGGGGGRGFDVSKAGDTRVGFVGFPSVGKSTLLTKLTGTHSEAAAYEVSSVPRSSGC